MMVIVSSLKSVELAKIIFLGIWIIYSITIGKYKNDVFYDLFPHFLFQPAIFLGSDKMTSLMHSCPIKSLLSHQFIKVKTFKLTIVFNYYNVKIKMVEMETVNLGCQN